VPANCVIPLTPAEKLVWEQVRSTQLGRKIRRQHTIEYFIADFYCASAKLVIEIDGDVRNKPDQAAYDSARTEWLKLNGYHVIRFENRDVQQNIKSVLQSITEAIEKWSKD
jgi:very-short-patch-repair endonuclease